MDLSLGFLFCSIDLYFCLCASTILSWRRQLWNLVWSQVDWFLQSPVPFFFLKITLAIWGFFLCVCIFIHILKLFVLVLWQMPLVVWQGLHWIYRLLWIVYSFSLYWFFWSMNMVYFSIYLYHTWFLSSVFYSFIYLDILFL